MIIQCAVEALAIVKDFDEIEDPGAGFRAGGKATAIDEFEFEGAPEAFHGGIVVTVALAAHGGHQLGCLERLAEVAGGKATAIDEFEFEGAPEAFHGGIVVTVALAAHGGHQLGCLERLAEVAAGILDAAI